MYYSVDRLRTTWHPAHGCGLSPRKTATEEAVLAILEHDIDFRFRKAYPHRAYCVRPAHRAELEAAGVRVACDKAKREVPFVIVRLGTEVRERVFLGLRRDFDRSAPDNVLAVMFNEAMARKMPAVEDSWTEVVGPGVAFIPLRELGRSTERARARDARKLQRSGEAIVGAVVPLPRGKPRAMPWQRVARSLVWRDINRGVVCHEPVGNTAAGCSAQTE
jgi:hypothetical protein